VKVMGTGQHMVQKASHEFGNSRLRSLKVYLCGARNRLLSWKPSSIRLYLSCRKLCRLLLGQNM